MSETINDDKNRYTGPDQHPGQYWIDGCLVAGAGDEQSARDIMASLDNQSDPTPSNDPNDYPLTGHEFTAALIRMGVEPDDVEPAIRQLFANDIDELADTVASWRNLKTMTRDNPTMALLKPTFSITDAQIDAAWMATVARRS